MNNPAFIVTHEITITVENTENVGTLVDSLLQCGIEEITQFEWQPNDEKDATEEAFSDGLDEGRKLCRNAGKRFSRIVSVEEVVEEEEEPAAGG